MYSRVVTNCRKQSNFIISRNVLDHFKIVYNKYHMYTSNNNYCDDQPALVPV